MADKTDMAENMLVAAIDQDRAAGDESYNALSPLDRGELVSWAVERNGRKLKDAPEWVLGHIGFWASLALMEAGLRFGQRQGV